VVTKKGFPLTQQSSGDRVAIYIRVSTVGQAEEGFSLDAQRKICQKFAEERGWKVIEVYDEPGVSAKDTNRPAFQRMIRAAAAGNFDIILTHKLDRFSRSILDVLTYLRDLNEASIAYVSATENFDFSTPMGKMQLHMMAAMAQWYLDNLSQETQKGKRARAEAGYWNGDPPFGYRVTDNRLLELDEREAEGVRLAFRMCGAGCHSDSAIAQALNDAGLRTRGKGRRKSQSFSKDTLRAMLRNRFYVGLTKYRMTGGRKRYEYYPGHHPAIIDEATWTKAQHARAARFGRPTTSKTADRIYPLTGLIRCRECNTAMRGQAEHDRRFYRDPAPAYGRPCDQVKLVAAEVVENRLVEFFHGLRLPDDIRDGVIRKLQGAQELDKSEEAKTRLNNQLERAKRLFVLGDISETEYQHDKARIESLRSQIQPVQTADLQEASKLLETFGTVLAKATSSEQKQFFHTVLQDVYVENKKVVAIRPKPIYYNLMCMSPADPTGFEPAISALTGPHVWPLHHGSKTNAA
jgi:DNA invertase Pin-like site-specific DNA recombinase